MSDEACKAFDRALTRFGAKYPGGHGESAQGSRGAAGLLRFPGRALDTYPDDEPDRIDVCDGTSENQAGPELWLPRDHPGDGLQAAGIGSKALEADQGI